MPKISVIIPMYGVEKYIRRCLDSMLNQTFTDWQAICVDDGSPDNCAAILDEYAKIGVNALQAATPVRSGQTAGSWSYEIHWSKGQFTINWTNSNLSEPGIPVAVLIQYGHVTKNGGFVMGRDYINPAIRPVFDKILNDAWKEVRK